MCNQFYCSISPFYAVDTIQGVRSLANSLIERDSDRNRGGSSWPCRPWDEAPTRDQSLNLRHEQQADLYLRKWSFLIAQKDVASSLSPGLGVYLEELCLFLF